MAEMADTPLQDTMSTGPAMRVLRAAVDTLLDGADPALAAQVRDELPAPLADGRRPYHEEPPALVDDFLERFRDRADLPRQDAVHHAKVALGLIDEMLSAQVAQDLRASLPPTIGTLFQRNGRSSQ